MTGTPASGLAPVARALARLAAPEDAPVGAGYRGSTSGGALKPGGAVRTVAGPGEASTSGSGLPGANHAAAMVIAAVRTRHTAPWTARLPRRFGETGSLASAWSLGSAGPAVLNLGIGPRWPWGDRKT